MVVWLGEGWQGSNTAMEVLRSLREDETLHLDPALDPSVSVHGLRLDSMELRGNLIRIFLSCRGGSAHGQSKNLSSPKR